LRMLAIKRREFAVAKDQLGFRAIHHSLL